MVPQSCPLLCPRVSPRVSCCPRGACPHVALPHLSTQAWHLSHMTSGEFHQKCRFIWNFYKLVHSLRLTMYSILLHRTNGNEAFYEVSLFQNWKIGSNMA